MSNKLVINVFGGPGIGKTTVAAELFTALKQKGVDTAIVPEFATDVIFEGRPDALKHQWYVVANQAYRIWCGYNTMQVVVTDSPILLGPIYDVDASPALLALCLEQHHKYNNLNLVLTRRPELEHNMIGRVHSLTESVSIDNRIVSMLEDNNIPFLNYDEYGTERILQLILRQINPLMG